MYLIVSQLLGLRNKERTLRGRRLNMQSKSAPPEQWEAPGECCFHPRGKKGSLSKAEPWGAQSFWEGEEGGDRKATKARKNLVLRTHGLFTTQRTKERVSLTESLQGG